MREMVVVNPTADGREAAIRRLLALSAPAYRVAVNVLGTPEGAEDVVQQAYLDAIRHFHSGPPPVKERAWFLQSVANLARKHLRSEVRRRRKEVAVSGQAGVASERPNSNMEMIGALNCALMAMGEEHRLPLTLCYQEGLSQHEAAEILNVHERAISRRVQEGLELLRKSLAKAGYTAAPAVVIGALAHTAPPVPATLAAALTKLVSSGAAVKGTGTAAAGAALKGGLLVKIGLGVAAAGLVAGGVFWAVGGPSSPSEVAEGLRRTGKSEEPKPAAPAKVAADYDPTAQPDFKGPEVVSGPDEPAIPGGAFKLEHYAFANTYGSIVDAGRLSSIAYSY